MRSRGCGACTQRESRCTEVYAARSVSEDRIASYVRAGLGVTVMPESLLQHGIAGRPLVGFDLRRTVAIVVHPQSASRIEQSGIAAMIAAAAAEQ